MAIVPEFRNLFEELENGYLEQKESLNSHSEKGKELLSILMDVVTRMESWSYPIMGHLWELDVDLSPKERSEHEEFVRLSKFQHILQEAPFFHQIINKPDGYAGDAEMMRIIYDNAFEGRTPFGRFVHKVATQGFAAQAVRNRRTFLREQILQVKNSGGGGVMS